MTRILVLGVNPFEDLPGYQLLSLLKSSPTYEVIAADDSQPALDILSLTGAKIKALPPPHEDPRRFTALVARLCEEHNVKALLPGTDAHLYALAECLGAEPQLASLCPTLKWLASKQLRNKWDLQEWASQFAMTPPRWMFSEEDARTSAEKGLYPLMIKGLRKGAIKCDDDLEAVVARRAILRNPANQGSGGGTYAETFVEGEEHSLFLLADGRGGSLTTFGFRKLASTQLGTTLAAQVDQELPSEIHIQRLLCEMVGPMALELEWRRDVAGVQWLFEVNVRFPSWIGSLGTFGSGILETYLTSLHHTPAPSVRLIPPSGGSVFYRLPQSGYLPLHQAFERAGDNWNSMGTGSCAIPRAPLLWKSASPHQFRVK
jgi:hypothetical protein